MTYMRTKGDKRKIIQDTHLTRPPRLEGVVKEANMLPKRKPRKSAENPEKKTIPKQQDSRIDIQRKQYHLKSPKLKRARS